MLTAQDLIDDIETGMREFGRYHYYDKGPVEVCDIVSLTSKLRDMHPNEVADILIAVMPHEHGAKYVSEVLLILDDWNHWEELMDALPPYIQNLY